MTAMPSRPTHYDLTFLLFILASLWTASTAFGAIEYFEVTPGTAAPIPASSSITVYQGTTVTIRVNGHGTDLAQSVVVTGTRVSAKVTGRKNGFQHTHYKTNLPLGELSIRITALSNASEGGRTVVIKYPLGQDRFPIVIKRKRASGNADVAGGKPFWPKKNGMNKLAAPFNAFHLFFPPIGADHKRGAGGNDLDCESYRKLPFPTCYRSHTGTDFLMSGGFTRMRLGSVEVIAAAPGEVYKIENTRFDRCFGDPSKFTINCDGRYGKDQEANYVIIKQDDGLYAGYYHLQNASVPSHLQKGIRVKCGEFLGKVGSSGTSTYPHLHFHLSRDSNHDNYKKDRF